MSQRRRARTEKRKQARAQTAVAAAAPREEPRPSSRREWMLLLGGLLAAAVVIAYRHAWTAGYIWDDDMYVTRNPLLTAADGWRRIWFSFDAPSQYFPLTYTTFRIEHAIWGLASAGYHWVNILIHAANAFLLWRLLRVLEVPAAWFGAALFALHPVQVESVAWVTERKNVLMGLFFLASLLAWVRFVDQERKRAWGWLALAFVLHLLALSAKTTACTLPAALVLILWWQRKPITAGRWLQIVPFVLAGLAAGVISILWERVHQGGRPDFIPIPWDERVLIGSRAIWFYLSKLAWPAELMFSYPRWDISRADPTDYIWLCALVGLVAAIGYARRWLGRGPEVAFVFFVATLSPLLGPVIVSTFQYTFVADHYQYLACIGPLALFAAGSARAIARLNFAHKEWLARVGAAVVLGALGLLTWQQAKMYRNEETLWLRTIAQNPASWMARNNLAAFWLGEKRYDEAIEQYRKIIELRPNEFLGYINLGAALAGKGDPAAAIEQYERALQLRADDPRLQRNLGQALLATGKIDEAIARFERALELRSRNDPRDETPELQLELGNALLQKGDVTEAMARYRRALELRPNFVAARANLGSALVKQGRRTEAIAELRAALALEPNDAATHNNLANALLQQGAADEARRHFEEAKRLNPGGDVSADVYTNAGNAALQKRDIDGAISNYRQALAIRPNYAEAHSNLGTAFLLQGNVAEAIREFETTLALAPQSLPTLNNLARLLATAPDPTLRDASRAARLAQQAVDLSRGRDPVSCRALGLALAEQGNFSEAEKAAEQAIALIGDNNPGLADVLRRERDAYRDGHKAVP